MSGADCNLYLASVVGFYFCETMTVMETTFGEMINHW